MTQTRARPALDLDLVAEGASRPFAVWLRVALEARRLSQRQLALRSGVAHSTISRLLTETRSPTLTTATALARALGSPLEAPPPRRPDAEGQPIARVEQALRSDPDLTPTQVRSIMDAYLAARRGNAAPTAEPATSRPFVVRRCAQPGGRGQRDATPVAHLTAGGRRRQ
jgi:transcriptional regulator with XRE-family HTH domain